MSCRCIKLLIVVLSFGSQYVFSQRIYPTTTIDTAISSGSFKLPTTISLPQSNNFPIAILIHGSGPIDKDCTIGPNKIFKQLADSLTARDIAIMRYDKRTKVYPKEIEAMMDSLTIEDETIDDVNTAVDFAANIKGVNKEKIFLIGHSLGAMVCPSILTHNKIVAGAVMLASPAFSFEDIIVKQYQYLYSLDTTNKAIEMEIPVLAQEAKTVKSIRTDTLIDKSSFPFSLPQSYWISLSRNYPNQYLSTLTKPLLILQGERDYQSTMDDFKLLQKNAQGNKKIEFKSYQKLDHLFFEGTGKSIPAEYYIINTIPSYVFDNIAKFILTH